MIAPRLTPWEKYSAREWRRSVVTEYGNVPLVRCWGRNKHGVAEWTWATLTPGFQAIPPEYFKSKVSKFLTPYHVKNTVFVRKCDALIQADDLMRGAGLLLLKNKHLAFL